MTLKLIMLEVGPWPMNAYILVDEESNTSAIVDPGADAKRILSSLEGTQVAAIMVTHGHADHVGALDEIKSATHAPVFMNPIDAGGFNLHFDQALQDGQLISIGNQQLRAIHTPGHTPGQTSLDLVMGASWSATRSSLAVPAKPGPGRILRSPCRPCSRSSSPVPMRRSSTPAMVPAA